MNRLLSIARAIRRDQRMRSYEHTNKTNEIRNKRESPPNHAEHPTNNYEQLPPLVFMAGMRVIVKPPPDRKTGRTYEPWAGIVRTAGFGTLWVAKEHDPVPALQGHAAYNVHPTWATPVGGEETPRPSP